MPDKTNEEPKKERTFWYSLARIVAGIGGHTIFPVRYHNRERFSQVKAPFILISNHKSAIDPLIIAYPCKDYEIRFVGKKELNVNKPVARLLEKLHMITVDRHNADLAAMRTCIRTLREGHALGIFPEGTRHLPDLMSEVETGTAVLALRANVPLLPVYLSDKPRFLRLNQVYIGEPMDISDLSAQGYDAQVVEQLTARIRETFLAMRRDAQKK